MRGRIKELFTQRIDGHWEILATAVGHDLALKQSSLGICADSLMRGVGGPAWSPSFVSLRVDAIAARSPKLLQSIVEQWKLPRDISADPMDDEADFWSTAWSKCLRHIHRLQGFRRQDTESRNYMISQECDVLWGRSPSVLTSWSDVVSSFRSGDVDYNQIRKLSNVPLRESVISSEHIFACLRAGQPFQSPLQLLRLLRGRSHCLDSAALELLRMCLEKWRELSIADCAHIIEILRERSVSLPDNFENEVLTAFEEASSPVTMIDLAFVLCDCGWQLP